MLTRTGNAAPLRAQLEAIKADLTRKHQNLVRAMLTDLVVNSPQWSGTLASQWGVEFKGRKMTYRPNPMKQSKMFKTQDAFQAGDDPAVASTLLRESAFIDQITYKTVVKLVNKTPYAAEVEEALNNNGQMQGGGKIRAVNLMSYFGAIGMIGYVDMKYRANNGAQGVLLNGNRY